MQTMDKQTEALAGVTVEDRRQHDRVTGPFDGRRVNLLETPVRIYDLSEGGCFVNSLHEQQPGVTVVLKIDLPYQGWITLTAQTLYRKPGFGFAVRFTELTEESLTRLRRTIELLKLRDQHT